MTVHGSSGFTMVEIALCLAIIGFALVAIIGVLPTGLQVQQENNTDTIINQDGSYFLEAIRSGSQGLFDLGRYVDGVRVYRSNQPPFAPRPPLSGLEIIGLLSHPNSTNIAKVRALTGSAAEQGTGMTNFAFGYLLTTQLMPLTNAFPESALRDSDVSTEAGVLASNVYELRLTLQWPVLPDGPAGADGRPEWRAGNGFKVFRTVISGQLTNPSPYYPILHFFQPSSFVP